MDRLHIVITAALVLTACQKDGGDEKGKQAGEEGRINAVGTVANKAVTVEEFCDVLPKTAAEAPPLALPPLAGISAPPPGGSWRWLNVWATWCPPCIDEMPLLAGWQKKLAAEGTKIDLVFISADESDEVLEAFRKHHPQIPPSLRLDRPESLAPWLAAIGLGENAPIPVHVLIDPRSKVRCVRAGQVKDSDLPAVRALLKPG